MSQKMYLGPSRPYGLGLMQHAIIIDPAGVAGLVDAMQEHPLLGRLMVEIKDVAIARQKIKESGTTLKRAYDQIKADTDELRKGRNGGK